MRYDIIFISEINRVRLALFQCDFATDDLHLPEPEVWTGLDRIRGRLGYLRLSESESGMYCQFSIFSIRRILFCRLCSYAIKYRVTDGLSLQGEVVTITEKLYVPRREYPEVRASGGGSGDPE